jgi:hypothetical protein
MIRCFYHKAETVSFLYGSLKKGNLTGNHITPNARVSTSHIRVFLKSFISIMPHLYRVFNLKVDGILIWVIYLLRFTTCHITQLTCIYTKCWKWCPFNSMHLSTRFTMFLANFLSVLSFTSSMAWVIYWRLPSKFFKKTLSTVGVRYRF